MSTKSYSNLDPDMAELFRQRDEYNRIENEKKNAPKLIRSLTYDDDAELLSAILPNEHGVSPPHSDDIAKVWDDEGYDAAVEKARKIRKSNEVKSNKGGKRRSNTYKKHRIYKKSHKRTIRTKSSKSKTQKSKSKKKRKTRKKRKKKR